MTDQEFNQEFDRGGSAQPGEIEALKKKLAKEAWLEATDIAYENWRDMQVKNIVHRGR